MKRKKPASLRDHAPERLRLGIIGALGIVLVLFVFLGNVSFKPANLTGRSSDVISIIDALIVDPPIIEPPKVDNKVVEITRADNDEDADTTLPGITADIYTPPGSDRINHTFDNLSIPPVDAIKPQLVGRLDVSYPERMRKAEAEGLVIVGAALDTFGRVFDTRLLKSSGFDELDKAAVEAVSKARFTPAIQHDKALAVKISVPVHFNLR